MVQAAKEVKHTSVKSQARPPKRVETEDLTYYFSLYVYAICCLIESYNAYSFWSTIAKSARG